MPTTTLAAAKKEVLVGMQRSKGTMCPCCDQKVKLYKRQITSSMAHQLVCLAKTKIVGFVHVEKWRSDVIASGGTMGGGEHGKLQFWGLIETDGKGYWKITQEGREFANGQGTVKKFARIFNNTFLGFDGPQVTIQGCLGVRYMLADLLAA